MKKEVCISGRQELMRHCRETFVKVENIALKANVRDRVGTGSVDWRIYAEVQNSNEEEEFRRGVILEVAESSDRLSILEHNSLPSGPLRSSVRFELEVMTEKAEQLTAIVSNGSLYAHGYKQLDVDLGNGAFNYEGKLLNTSEIKIQNGSLNTDAQILNGHHNVRAQQGNITMGLHRASSVRYRLVVDNGIIINTIGRLSTPLPGLLSNVAEGTIGEGKATLDVYCKQGVINLSYTPG